LPGWRLGWIIVYNRHNHFDKVLTHLDNLQKMIFPPTSFIQYALPKILDCYDDAYYVRTVGLLAESAQHVHQRLSGIRGVQPIKTKAGMFMMIKIILTEFRVR
jgi:tyrosine aminotransferase